LLLLCSDALICPFNHGIAFATLPSLAKNLTDFAIQTEQWRTEWPNEPGNVAPFGALASLEHDES
jgi:hypothetical protein